MQIIIEQCCVFTTSFGRCEAGLNRSWDLTVHKLQHSVSIGTSFYKLCSTICCW